MVKCRQSNHSWRCGQRPQGVGRLHCSDQALLNNQADRFGLYTEMVGLRRFLWHGDIKDSETSSCACLVVATPDVEVMLTKVPHAQLFGDLRALVVDEVH